jgi:hypothetical protein
VTTGLPWRNGAWLLEQLDRPGVLSEPERADVHELGDQWAQRTVQGDVDGDLYAASWALVAALRERHQVEDREPLPDVEPIDLDAPGRESTGASDDLYDAARDLIRRP